PRLAVEFQGPVGKTRAIGFLPTGNRLYAGGEGKVIDLFDVQDEFVTINSPGRWEFARGARGGINDIALTADGVHALMAGFSARGARDVTILNLTTRQVVGVLPRQPVGGPDSNAHSFSSILSVAVSPDSRHAASASANGEIWLWDLSQGFAQAVGRKIRNADASFVSEFNAIGFPDSDTLLYSLPNAAPSTGFQAVIYRISSGSKQYSGDQFQREVCAVTSSSDGSRIAIADTSGQVVIRDSGIGSPSRPLGPQSFGVLRNAVLSPSGQLLALMGDQAGSADSVLSLIDLTQNSLLDSITFSGKEACVTAAFDRDEARLLAHDNSREYLLLWNLRDAQGQRIPEPLQKESLAIGSRAQQFRTGRFLRDRSSAADGYRIQLATADGVFQYSLTDGEAEVAEQVPTIGGNEFSGGWNPEFLTEGQVTSLVQLTSPAGAVHQIRVDVVKQGELTGAYCFLPGSDRLPAAIALGTRKADGIYVYGLRGIPPQIQGATGLLRYFRDHNGEIRDLSVSHDGRYLLSTSVDRTLKLWSLEGLIDAGRKSIFGADIVTDGREVRIQNVRPAGIFYGRNLRDGDRLVRAVSVRTPPQGVTDAAGIVDLLKTNSPFEEMYLWTDRLGAGFREGGDDDRVVLVPGWEPLMTLVVDKSDEWVLFTPEGYYNASPAEGHRLFGWQYNLGRDKTPRFEVAASLQKEFEKPDLMRSILQQGSVAEALGAAGLPVPNDFQVALREQIESLPQISIQAPADNSIVPTGQPVSVRARVEIPQGRQPQDFEFQADVGGRSLGPPQLNPDGQFVICSWQTVVPDPVNTLRVSVTERNGSLTRSLQTDRTVTVRSESPSLRPSRPKLYLIALGAE
ncbi:MAG: WD40 repeat domain-containing protein, partial [Planctomyces sp.]